MFTHGGTYLERNLVYRPNSSLTSCITVLVLSKKWVLFMRDSNIFQIIFSVSRAEKPQVTLLQQMRGAGSFPHA